MGAGGHSRSFSSAVVALTLLAPCGALAAGDAAPVAPGGANSPTPEQLGEVTVTAEKPTRQPSVLIDWIRRLLGQYTIDGKVDLGGKGEAKDRWTAVGTGTCIGFGLAPGVQCEMTVRWPQIPGPHGVEVMSGVSDLAPAMTLYGMEPDDLGIRYLQVNNKGLAEGGVGFIIGDTATFKTPCVNAPAGCQRITRITVASEAKVIEMQIDTEVNYQLAARFNFKLRRVAQPQAELATQPAVKTEGVAAPPPAKTVTR